MYNEVKMKFLKVKHILTSTLQHRYNAVAYNTETVITRLGRGSHFFFPHQFESVALFPRNAAVLKSPAVTIYSLIYSFFFTKLFISFCL